MTKKKKTNIHLHLTKKKEGKHINQNCESEK